MRATTNARQPLICGNCATVANDEAKGWRAYLDDEGQAVTFCPKCAEQEFGDDD